MHALHLASLSDASADRAPGGSTSVRFGTDLYTDDAIEAAIEALGEASAAHHRFRTTQHDVISEQLDSMIESLQRLREPLADDSDWRSDWEAA